MSTLHAIKRLLVTVDFSAYTNAVLQGAAAMARSHNAAIDVMHVWRPPHFNAWPAPADDPPPRVDHIAAEAKAALRRAEAHLREAGVKHVVGRLVEGTASAAILALLEAEAYDLVVMGNHGHTGLPHAYVGSVTERVIRSSPTPVLVIPTAPMISRG